MSATTLYLVRHARTVWNEEGRIQGLQDSPITEVGLIGARAIARRLMREKPTVIYTSDLGRAVRTADEIAAATRATLRQDPTLREKNVGVFEGLTQAELAARYPDLYASERTRDPDHVVPGGESRRQVQVRAINTLERLARTHPGERVVVVSHGALISSFVRFLLDVPIQARWSFHLDNCSLNTVYFRPDTPYPWRLVTLNEVMHLDSDKVVPASDAIHHHD